MLFTVVSPPALCLPTQFHCQSMPPPSPLTTRTVCRVPSHWTGIWMGLWASSNLKCVKFGVAESIDDGVRNSDFHRTAPGSLLKPNNALYLDCEHSMFTEAQEM